LKVTVPSTLALPKVYNVEVI